MKIMTSQNPGLERKFKISEKMKLVSILWKCKFIQVDDIDFWPNGFFAIAAPGVTLGAF